MPPPPPRRGSSSLHKNTLLCSSWTRLQILNRATSQSASALRRTPSSCQSAVCNCRDGVSACLLISWRGATPPAEACQPPENALTGALAAQPASAGCDASLPEPRPAQFLACQPAIAVKGTRLEDRRTHTDLAGWMRLEFPGASLKPTQCMMDGWIHGA